MENNQPNQTVKLQMPSMRNTLELELLEITCLLWPVALHKLMSSVDLSIGLRKFT